MCSVGIQDGTGLPGCVVSVLRAHPQCLAEGRSTYCLQAGAAAPTPAPTLLLHTAALMAAGPLHALAFHCCPFPSVPPSLVPLLPPVFSLILYSLFPKADRRGGECFPPQELFLCRVMAARNGRRGYHRPLLLAELERCSQPTCCLGRSRLPASTHVQSQPLQGRMGVSLPPLKARLTQPALSGVPRLCPRSFKHTFSSPVVSFILFSPKLVCMNCLKGVQRSRVLSTTY